MIIELLIILFNIYLKILKIIKNNHILKINLYKNMKNITIKNKIYIYIHFKN